VCERGLSASRRSSSDPRHGESEPGVFFIRSRWLLGVGRGQDRDLLRAGLLGDRHDVYRTTEVDVLVAADEQRLGPDLREGLANLGLQVGRIQLARPEV